MSKTIAALSDTHGVLRPEVVQGIMGCDAIIHAGDFADGDVLSDLEAIAPLYAVQGNNDWELAGKLPESLVFTIEDCKFFLIHNKYYVPKDLAGIDGVIFGHSHQFFQEEIDGRLWLNPGSCGRPRFNYGLSYVIMQVDGKDISIKRVNVPI